MTQRQRLLLVLALCILLGSVAWAQAKPIDQFPAALDPNCRTGTAQIYDECGSQAKILQAALDRAAATGKQVLVVYGSEWCIWCHVLDQYFHGTYHQFDYAWEVEGAVEQWTMYERDNPKARIQATVLNRFVADTFVVAHIEGTFSADGIDVMADTGFDIYGLRAIPLVMVVDAQGQYVAHMADYDQVEGLEIREDSGEEFRGFNRHLLLKELLQLRNAGAQP
ncbi:thioredoxin family protein [Marinicella meishanensis]|uniref:thioredoxin family protein n=1 Tax=Marinicella meishanensis TaxID=2873263 RepID=UPI001CBDB96F|nr:thioredoxin family protein [Marinicella sp. NBU2979]